MIQRMNVSAAVNNSLLESVLEAESTRVEIGVAVMKKAQDLQEQQGQAMISLLEKSAPSASGRLDVYA